MLTERQHRDRKARLAKKNPRAEIPPRIVLGSHLCVMRYICENDHSAIGTKGQFTSVCPACGGYLGEVAEFD